MLIKEISKQDGNERLVSLDEAIERLEVYHDFDGIEVLKEVRIMQTAFYYFEVIQKVIKE